MKLDSYKIISIDKQNCDFKVQLNFSDGSDVTQTLSINDIAMDVPYESQVEVGRDEDDNPIMETRTEIRRETKKSFNFSDSSKLDEDIKTYTDAYLAGEQSSKVIIDKSVSDIIGKVQIIPEPKIVEA